METVVPFGRSRERAGGAGEGALTMEKFKFYPEMPIESLRRNPKQPRKTFAQDALKELAGSIRSLGVVQPIIARIAQAGEGFEIIAGERRWRAAQMAALDTVPVIIRSDVDDLTAMTMAMVENLQREDLNPIEEAAGYQLLIEEFGLTHEEVAKTCTGSADKGVSRERVTRLLRLFQLPNQVQAMVATMKLSFAHAELLLKKEVQAHPGKAMELANKAINEELSRRQLLALIQRLDETQTARQKAPRKNSDWEKLEQKYSEYLGSPMQINSKGSGFQVVIDCDNLDIVQGVLEKFNLPED